MKPGIPWSVKGIDSEAREAAKHAARRSGMTLGEWLNTVILDKSTEEPPRREERRPPARGGEDISAQLGDLAQQLARLSQRDQDTRYHEPAPSELSHELTSELLSRIETGERQAAEAFSSVNDRLNALNRQLNELPTPVQRADPAESPAFHALESALRNVVDHIEVSEKRTRETIKGMQDRLTAMALRAASAESEAVAQTGPAIERLESRLAGMAERLERTESAAQRDLPGLVQGELKRLGERIDGVKASADATAQRTQSATQRELRDMESRIHTLFSDAQTQMRSHGGSAAEYQALRGEIEGLAQRFDDLKADAASERDLNGLRVAVEQLSARIAQGPDLRPFADMDRRLADLTKRLERSHDDPQLGSQLNELDRRVHDLDRRLAEASRHGDSRATEALHAQLDAIAERIEGTERQLGHIVSLDRSVSQLYESIEQSRAFAREAAEDAAGRMAERLMQMQPQQGAPTVELQALQQGLAAVRASAADADRRNQETLEAVHETLEQIVNRLTDMEARSTQAAPAQPQSAWQPPPEPEPRAATWQPPAELPREPIFPPEPQAPAFAPLPPEPAMGQPATPDFGAAPREPEPQLPRDDFIAAARRAAQAAAQRQAMPLGNGGGLKASGLKLPKVPSFSWPFARRKAARAAAAPVGNGKKNDGGSRRRLILAGLVLLAAVSAFTFGNYYKSQAPAPKAPIEQQQAPETEPSGAKPPQPRPTGGDTGMPDPQKLEPEQRKTSAMATDGIMTAALPVAKQDATLASIVAEPGTAGAAGPLEMAPPEAGPESLRRAAANGDPAAQFILAGRYLDGKDTQQDFTEAARWYQQAANAGLAPAQYRIATLFERGRGVPQDVATARIWYERAAERGNVKAMHNAAVISAGKQAGAPDYTRAAKWFTLAAQHGLRDSQFNLAVLYERGMGVAPDQSEALFWYSLAGRQNDTDALAKAAVIEQGLPHVTAETVKARITAWKAMEATPDANVVAISDPQWQASLAPSAALEVSEPAAAMEQTVEAALAPAQGDGDIVLRAQELLAELGFNVGKPDGRMGSRTANAIRLFELQQGLKVTGQVSPELIAQLEARSG